MYALGIQKLRDFAKEKKLHCFHSPKAGGLHRQKATGENSNSEGLPESSPENGSSE